AVPHSLIPSFRLLDVSRPIRAHPTRELRIVRILLRERQIDVVAVVRALLVRVAILVGPRRPDGLWRAAVLIRQPPEITHAMAGEEERQRALAEEQVDAPRQRRRNVGRRE